MSTPAAFIAFAFASMERVGDGLILLALSESINNLSLKFILNDYT
jgi:hypothetical protein